jgi:excisionase family DNA binding protein
MPKTKPRSRTASPDASPYRSIVEAAEYLRVSERFVREAIRRGRLRSFRAGRRVLLSRDDLDAFVRGGHDPAEPQF